MAQRIGEEQRKKISAAFEEAGVDKPCPRCGENEFSIMDGYFTHVLQEELANLALEGAGIPTVVTVCTNCGFLSQHALGALDLLPEEEDTVEEGENG